jgi:hypothetical protein
MGVKERAKERERVSGRAKLREVSKEVAARRAQRHRRGAPDLVARRGLIPAL